MGVELVSRLVEEYVHWGVLPGKVTYVEIGVEDM